MDEVQALAVRAKLGDAAAFADLYRAHYNTVFRYVLRRVRHRQIAEDLTQDAFLRAWQRIAGFQWTAGGFGAWLTTIARNLVVDHIKSAANQRSSGLEVPDNADQSRFADPADAAVHTIEAYELRLAILRLASADQAEAVLHRYIDELSIREACEVMGLTEGAMKALCGRAQRNLRRALVPS